ncbi:glycoside hydrolase family 3 C-terminal domain-containing protein [Mangrovimonas sp. AS39]|uniref:glycoside hydrolase family 3 N-terminal domain-containing protein n=1 Tax=Mangrovimonas futianensis TaxID=2895523 RepID=UPI001E60B4BE|nr:glycoside hydrolase family 3 N-terminal domain-containing protein [Mangrovimonas futianensis]MCF1190046.1 glycoside hydrolase family 3 C-terminal domain-containing protein [Mangrovimonas futianensis]MCF1194203.1 glycoside hydrolase family 3 C-terminal domain-containing protein [Mangrovimonas futianensis]
MNQLKHTTFLICFLTGIISWSQNYEAKVDSLMKLMTLQEKIGQTVMYSGSWDQTGPIVGTDNGRYIREGNLGAMLNAFTVKGTRDLQKIAIEESRLGIPLLFGYDVIHGHRTIFPINLGMSCSWDLNMVEESSRIAAEEASAEGLHWTFAPMVDISREPRWGRISEGAGEDVYLGSQIAKAYVKGFQGDDLSQPNTILACAKHYVAYGAAQAGRDYHTVNMGEGELRNVYLPPFKATVDAGVETFMSAFNELNGVPTSGNKFTLRDILRDEWNFKGFVVSDYTSINELVPHGFAKDSIDAARIGMNAGVDMDMVGKLYHHFLKDLVEEGQVPERYVDDACKRILLAKYKLGLFEDPYRYINEERENTTKYKPEFLAKAREIAAASSVLLQNNREALPLSKSTNKIAFIGPLVKDEYDIIGNWAAKGDRQGKAVSVFEGISEYLKSNQILYAKGCDILKDDESGFAEAISVSKQAEEIVLVMGEGHHMSGEAASRTNLKIPGLQPKLIKKIREANPDKKITLVIMNGRPLNLSEEVGLVDAILEVWFPGTMGGAATADLLFGEVNPSGKLSVTFPRNVGQVPIYYNMKNTGRPIPETNPKEDYKSNYIDVPNSPLFSFGYGLSYTQFTYSNLTLSSKTLNANGTLKASVTITNSGNMDGHEIVQLYIHDKVGSVTRPVKELKGFKKIFLKKGESKKVSFSISIEDLKFYNSDMIFGVEPGEFEIAIAPNSEFKFNTSFYLE